MSKKVVSEDLSIGFTVIERQLLLSLSSLWVGGFTPKDALRAERALRAIITGNTLAVSRYFEPWSEMSIDDARNGSVFFKAPFDEPELAYEFTMPEAKHNIAVLDRPEADFLEKFVFSSIVKTASRILPKWIKRNNQAQEFYDAWYQGYPIDYCEEMARLPRDREIDDNLYDSSEYLDMISHQVVTHAKYLVGCSRAGAVVYGDSPVAEICTQHIFAKWPEHLFLKLDDDFRKAARQIRGPNLAFTLPPLLHIVLSRATVRHMIPATIRDLREEYAPARQKLWLFLDQMWNSDSFSEQIKCLRKLEDASNYIFKAAFPERLSALSLGLSIAGLSPSAVADAGMQLLEHDRPRAKVAAIDFTRKLSKDLHRDLINSRAALLRHLSSNEALAFGLN